MNARSARSADAAPSRCKDSSSPAALQQRFAMRLACIRYALELRSGPFPADAAVLMKAVAPVRAAIERASVAADLVSTALRGDGVRRVYRMMEMLAVQDAVRLNLLRAVQGNHEHRRRVQRLQNIHVVGDRDGPAVGSAPMIVPGGARAGCAREHTCIGMHDGVIGLIRKGREYFLLERRWWLEHAQRLVTVAREHDVVEAFDLTARRAYEHSIGSASHSCDRSAEPGPAAPGRGEPAHVLARAAPDRAPFRPVVDAEKAVAIEELEEESERTTENRRFGRRPDRAPHRHDIT